MCLPITTSIEMDCAKYPTPANREDRIASFVCALVDPKSRTAECEHFWHEGHPLHLTVRVQCLQDLFFGAHFHPVSDTKFAPRWLHYVSSSFEVKLDPITCFADELGLSLASEE